ncbi:MAG: hypothetical protein N3A02_08410, partial [Rectinema sp.]|nr:hypothetical protein [Rectinema sp.]
MRLYSKTQIILAVSIAVAVTAICMTAVILTTAKKAGGQPVVMQIGNGSAPAPSAAVGSPGLNSVATSLAIPISSDTYTAEELQNISIYEKYNESVVNITTEVIGINWFLDPVP